MSKTAKLGCMLWGWIELLLIIPVLVLDFTVPVLFESPDFWSNKILLATVGLLFLYPFVTSWAVLRAKIARKEEFFLWTMWFLIWPLFVLGGVLVLYFKLHQVEMDKVLALLFFWV